MTLVLGMTTTIATYLFCNALYLYLRRHAIQDHP